MAGKLHRTEKEKFKDSLKAWDDTDNRPFIRNKIDENKDRICYEKKRMKIFQEKLEVAAISGDPVENINLIDPWGHTYSKGGNIRDYEN